MRTISTLALFGLLVAPLHVAAATFPDVPDGHVFQQSIEELVRAGVVNGNPDGTFDPDANVNRAAMLKMLYLAEGKTPDPLSVRCFPDVVIDSWYEPYVCDAAARRYVNGYPDGTFGPDKPVKRVEALKMISTVFAIPLDKVTDENREIVNFADVSLSAWYTQYLLTAYNTGILPIPGEQGAYFYPDRELTRGEAAAYIYNALRAELSIERQQYSNNKSSTASSDSSVTSSASSTVSQVQDSSSSSQSSVDQATAGRIDTSLPFTKSGKFTNKESVSYLFDVSAKTTVSIEAALQPGQPGQLSCRLYKVAESGFSDEYFLGYQEGKNCYLKSTVSAGSYQLQLLPTQANTTFSVEAKVQSGDGNDGFADAKTLSVNKQLPGILTASDYEDWFTFSLISEQKLTVVAENPAELRCIVYAMSDVDLQSFSGPQCNQIYTYPSGTYFISVGRKAPKASQQSYTIELQK